MQQDLHPGGKPAEPKPNPTPPPKPPDDDDLPYRNPAFIDEDPDGSHC